MSKLKRISLIALIVYAVLIPVGFLSSNLSSSNASFLGATETTETSDRFLIAGEVYFPRGGQVHFFGEQKPLVIGVASFEWASAPGSSSEELLRGLTSGEIPHGRVTWRINWDAIFAGYLAAWMAVGLLFLIRSLPRTKLLTPQEIEELQSNNSI